LIIFTFSCQSIKKAEQRVLLDPVARHNVFLKELQFWPCANDSVFKYLPGRVDSIPVEKLITIKIADDYLLNRKLDSIKRHTQDVCNDAINNAFTLGFDEAANEFKKLKVAMKANDTMLYSVRDRQIVKLVQDSLTKAERHIYGLEQQNIVQRERLDERKKEASKYLFWFIGAVVIGVASNIIWAKSKL
jgi:hypothetical protein